MYPVLSLFFLKVYALAWLGRASKPHGAPARGACCLVCFVARSGGFGLTFHGFYWQLSPRRLLPTPHLLFFPFPLEPKHKYLYD